MNNFSLILSSVYEHLNLTSEFKIAMFLTSGDATKACVCGLASFRPVKLRLYEDTIVLRSPFLMSCLPEKKKYKLKAS